MCLIKKKVFFVPSLLWGTNIQAYLQPLFYTYSSMTLFYTYSSMIKCMQFLLKHRAFGSFARVFSHLECSASLTQVKTVDRASRPSTGIASAPCPVIRARHFPVSTVLITLSEHYSWSLFLSSPHQVSCSSGRALSLISTFPGPSTVPGSEYPTRICCKQFFFFCS